MLCILAITAVPVMAQTVKVGDTPPALYIGKWVQGDPVEQFRKGHIYVVVLTTSGCPGCRKIIPGLTAMGDAFAGSVSVVSVYMNPLPLRKNDARSPAELQEQTAYMERYVAELKKHFGDRMGGSIGVDNAKTETRLAWGNYISTPSLFVIDRQGSVAWRGGGADDLTDLSNEVLPQLLAGTFDAEAAARRQAGYYAALARLHEFHSDGDYPAALAVADSLLAHYPLKQNLYLFRFSALARIDRCQAADYMQWMLAHMGKEFVWDKVGMRVLEELGEDGAALALEIADRNIAVAETSETIAAKIVEKANLLFAIAAKTDDTGLQRAYRELLSTAIAIYRITGQDKKIEGLQKSLLMASP